MLNALPRGCESGPSKIGNRFASCIWIDLLNPTGEETAAVEQAFGLRVPTRNEVSEVEATSRIRAERHALYMSAPLIELSESGWKLAPAGFVLSRTVCITVRFARLGVFDTVIGELTRDEKLSPAHVFTRIVEELVDWAADQLEVTADGLDKASLEIFQEEDHKRSRLSRDTNRLRRLMTRIGRASERMLHLRYTLACLDRMAQFTTARGGEWMIDEVKDRLQAVRTDIASLDKFEEDLSSRVQLLQDASASIISIEQNDVVKVLTVASVVAVPPVVIAGIYGMNFKHMPELNWFWRYPFALILIVVSALLPLISFKLKDWI